MVLTARRQELIKILEATAHDAPLTVKQLAGRFGVSERTIRYDLDFVEEALKHKGLVLCKQTNRGVWIEATAGLTELPRLAFRDYVLSRRERCQAIVVYLLTAGRAAAAEELAEHLLVSRSTLLADLESVKELLVKYQAELASKRGLGLWIEGKEKNLRNLLVQIFCTGTYDVSAPDQQEGEYPYEAELFHAYAGTLPVAELAAFMIRLLQEQSLAYTDFSINYMVISLSVQLKRLQQGRRLEEADSGGFSGMSGSFFAGLARQIAAELSRHDHRISEEGEVTFIIRQLLGSQISCFSRLDEGERQKVNLLALNLAESFIKSCQRWLGDIYADDEELLYGLALHLQPAIERARCKVTLTNPMLPQIREKYGELFAIVLKAVREIEQELGAGLSEDEIGYLTIHFGAAIERKKSRAQKSLKVVLVCGNGIGTAKLLSITLKSRMPYLDIVKVLSLYEWKQQTVSGVDLVISTVPLKRQDAAVLHVSPILSALEMQVIENQIQSVYHKKFAAVEALDLSGSLLGLKDVLLPSSIELDVRAGCWEEAIRQAGRLLVAGGAAEERYIDSMIACVKKIGPYIVIAPGIAMPHSRPEDGVKRICLSMVRLAEAVSFSDTRYEPVDLVFAFGAVDHESHFRVLSELWQMLKEPATVQGLRQAADKAAVLALIPDCRPEFQ